MLPWLLRQVARTGSRELFTLAVLAMALGIAFGAATLFGVSFALGAFFAGMVLNESELSHKAAANSLPLQDAFGVLFFVSVGMLFDPAILVREPAMVAAVLGLILVGKSLVALVIVLLLGYPLGTALIGRGRARSDRGVLLHPGWAGPGLWAARCTGVQPDPGRRTVLDHAQSARVRRGRSACHAPVRRGTPSGHVRPAWHGCKRSWTRPANRPTSVRMPIRPLPQRNWPPASRYSPTLTPEQREVLVLHFQPHTAEPGERIIRAGDAADALYLIAKGEVEVTIDGRRINTQGPGEFFGEMALLSGERRSADVTALDYSRFAMLSRRDFHRFLRRYPEIRTHLAGLAAERSQRTRGT